jgi:hypothetical protein
MNFYGARSVIKQEGRFGPVVAELRSRPQGEVWTGTEGPLLGECLYKPLVCPYSTFVNQIRKTTKHHVQAGTYQFQPLYNQSYTRTLFYLTIVACHYPSALVTSTCKWTRIFESKENAFLVLNMFKFGM